MHPIGARWENRNWSCRVDPEFSTGTKFKQVISDRSPERGEGGLEGGGRGMLRTTYPQVIHRLCTVFRWLLTRKRASEPPPDQVPASVRERVHRLEMDLQELTERFQLHQVAYQRFQGKVFGHLGAPARDAVRGSRSSTESLDEYRDRMLRSGRLVPQSENHNGEH